MVQRHGADEAPRPARSWMRPTSTSTGTYSGWQGGFVARYGYYSPVPSTAKKFLTPNEWDYWYEGKPATEAIIDPYGVPMEKAGAKRDGGSFLERVTNISCWNTLMDEAQYMNKRWNDFKAA